MANITAKDVAALRAKTGCGMMDCKKALVEANGDTDEAIKLLREKGLAVAAKKADRIAAEGLVDTYYDDDKKVGVVIEVNSETDFVAKNENFREFVRGIAKTIVETEPADVQELLGKTYFGDTISVEQKLRDMILSIGENMNIRRFVVEKGVLSTYVHGGGRIGVMVSFDADDAVAANPGFAEIAKDIAMQIAAITPLYVGKDNVPADVIANEKEILINQAKNDEKNKNKPDAIIEKMVTGRLGKYYEENCLLEQGYIKDDSVKVGKYLAQVGKEFGGKLTVKSFVRFERGEGLAKREDNFAAEISSMLK